VVGGRADWYDHAVTAVTFSQVADEAALHRYREIWAASFAADFDALPADPIDDYRPVLSGPVNGEDVEFWLGTSGRTDVAGVAVRCPIHDNLDLAMVAVNVHPDQRRRGHGHAAAEMALRRVRELGRTRILGEVPSHTRQADPSPAAAFVRSFDMKPLLTERRRLLDVTSVDAARLDRLIEEAREHAAGYSFVTWADRAPPELADDMAGLMALMSTDPPRGSSTSRPRSGTPSVITRTSSRSPTGTGSGSRLLLATTAPAGSPGSPTLRLPRGIRRSGTSGTPSSWRNTEVTGSAC
jgi:GNAT superfamily N-acetyltransferase